MSSTFTQQLSLINIWSKFNHSNSESEKKYKKIFFTLKKMVKLVYLIKLITAWKCASNLCKCDNFHKGTLNEHNFLNDQKLRIAWVVFMSRVAFKMGVCFSFNKRWRKNSVATPIIKNKESSLPVNLVQNNEEGNIERQILRLVVVSNWQKFPQKNIRA